MIGVFFISFQLCLFDTIFWALCVYMDTQQLWLDWLPNSALDRCPIFSVRMVETRVCSVFIVLNVCRS